MQIKNVTLEVSLKPFYDTSEKGIQSVCREIYRQWAALIQESDQVSVMFWTGDGSELLTYPGKEKMDEPFEWARYIGNANPRMEVPNDPNKEGLHSRSRLYRPNPPVFTYRLLKQIVTSLRDIGREMTGKPIRIGTTFDPGGEFAVSQFKYEKHNEICLANTMGKGTFVTCYSTLHADQDHYAGFPHGIPEGTSFGAFLGRQSQHFLTDIGFDYIWFSNGLGFGSETWRPTGELFNGTEFNGEKACDIRDKIIGFWQAFRKECPHFPIETRGTNLGTGVDLASDAVPTRDIYEGDFNMTPPVNSPWAALDGDFGVELMGYMGHIAELPAGKGFPFRYYVHDPWWLNSPWLDRYGREPHDIYLPLSIGRVNEHGKVENPSSVAILTIDNSFGGMPKKCPDEVIPHLLCATQDAPDACAPLVWAYPFDEYHDMTFGAEARLSEPFFGDWFVRTAINNGLPLNTVVSTKNWVASLKNNHKAYQASVIVILVPDGGSSVDRALREYVRNGGKVLLYGPTDRAGPELLAMLNLGHAESISGEMNIRIDQQPDCVSQQLPVKIQHRSVLSAGGISEIAADEKRAGFRILAHVEQNGKKRIAAASHADPNWHGGKITWVRGTNSSEFHPKQHAILADAPDQWFAGDLLLRTAMREFGHIVEFHKQSASQRNPVLTIASKRNAWYYSGYTPDTTVEYALRHPLGAPIFIGTETIMTDGKAHYRMPRAWHRECRVFVEQKQNGTLSCTEHTPETYGTTRKILIKGLVNATVRFLPDASVATKPELMVNASWPFVNDPRTPAQEMNNDKGLYLEAHQITGNLIISW